jgi:hypothetical protein
MTPTPAPRRARLPSVTALAPIVRLSVLPVDPGGRPVLASVAAAPLDHRWRHLIEIPKVLDGRLPLADRPGEIAVDQNGARALGLHVGSTLAMKAIPAGPSPGANTGARRAPLRERVVGIIVTTGQLHRLPRSGPPDRRQMARAGPARAQQAGPSHVRRRRSHAASASLPRHRRCHPRRTPGHVARRRGTHSRRPPGPSSPRSYVPSAQPHTRRQVQRRVSPDTPGPGSLTTCGRRSA